MIDKTDKIFRDPLYDYVVIDRVDDDWLLDLIDTPEVQRLRRIHQLGVSHFTYPGADHSRLSHTLGVLHLMQQAWRRIETVGTGLRFKRPRECLLAAALLHDVGHGPFSHLSKYLLGIDHETWSCQIIRSRETEVHQKLVKYDISPEHVAALIDKENRDRPPWEKALVSSELDVDRLDFLRRDSYFTGAGYGHFDSYRILSSFSLDVEIDGQPVLAWPEKAIYAIEEYIFARFYMYRTVYQHKTTRGFEKLLHATWERAKQMHSRREDAYLVVEIREFLDAPEPSVKQYLALEDATVVYQLKVWTRHPDKVLNDLAQRFLKRDRFVAIADPVSEEGVCDARVEWESELHKLVQEKGFDPEFYALRDDLKLAVYNPHMPYMPEKEEEEQDPYNAIFIKLDDTSVQEISRLLDRLAAVTGPPKEEFRYYVPDECGDAAKQLANSRPW